MPSPQRANVTKKAKFEINKAREGLLLEENIEDQVEREREQEEGGILKAPVTPVTSHLSNPAPA